jgi:hypothetical protein
MAEEGALKTPKINTAASMVSECTVGLHKHVRSLKNYKILSQFRV